MDGARRPIEQAILRPIPLRRGFESPATERVPAEFLVGNESRPDIGLFDHDSHCRFMVESTFWAGLTLVRSTNCLAQLDDDRSGALVFVAFQARVLPLGSELVPALPFEQAAEARPPLGCLRACEPAVPIYAKFAE
jgi:hypothetical protein